MAEREENVLRLAVTKGVAEHQSKTLLSEKELMPKLVAETNKVVAETSLPM